MKGEEIKTIIYEIKKLNINKNIDINRLNEQINNIYIKLNEINEENINKINLKDDYNLIAKMIYINKKIFGFEPRTIQIVALLNFINKNQTEGLIQQINTGEGKSLIIYFLAVYISIRQRKKVDIITSSSVLAERDSLLYKDFYNSFNLNVSYNSNHIQESKEHNDFDKIKNIIYDNYLCYDADIIYGDILSFAGDILRTDFMKKRGRGIKRKFDCIIIDEIDNIALDNLKNSTELLDSFHGYKFIEYIYFFIFTQLLEIKKRGNYDSDTAKEKKEEIIKELYIVSQKEFSDIKLLNKKNIYIPLHLHQYIKDRLNNWIESAFMSLFIYNKNENYIIKKNEKLIDTIYPIDFYNTGTLQENSVWPGLHQFLQIKEGKMLTEENLSTCYMSNFTFFNKYKKTNSNGKIIENNIYGLTGTVGSNYNIKILNELYNLNVLIIPPFKKSQFKKENPIIIKVKKKEKNKKIKIDFSNKNKEEIKEIYIKKFEEKVMKLMKAKRAVLIIFQYIEQVEIAFEEYKNKKNKLEIKKLIKYSRSDIKEESDFLKENITSQTVILSTNISGRGTDIKISQELEKNGGLHVILTYEPFNDRIEKQALGRAGRKGEKGSGGKLIISIFNEAEIINERDKRDKEEYDFLVNNYRYKIEAFEIIFEKFTKFLEKIKKMTDDEIILMDIKEKWGLFLIENNLDKLEKIYKEKNSKIDYTLPKELEKKYDIFEENLNNYNFNRKINEQNPYKVMNPLYLNKSKNLKDINESITRYPNLSLRGYMFRIIENIKKIKEVPEENKQLNESIINDINRDFNLLIEKINELIKQFEIYEKLIINLKNSQDSDLFIQNRNKKEIMEFILNIMKNNNEVFKNYIKDKKKYCFDLKKFSLKYILEMYDKKYNIILIEYFQELGLCLFKLCIKEKNNNGCIII